MVFPESVFDNLLDDLIESPLSNSASGSVFHVFIPPVIITALTAKHSEVIRHRLGKIDDRFASSAFEECNR
jgi:hypothetical protein